MNRYASDPAAIRGLIRPDSIHRDVYLEPELFESGEPGSGQCVLRTPFVYVEAQRDRQLMLVGVAYQHLLAVRGEWKIRMKKIELLNRDAALPSIELLL